MLCAWARRNSGPARAKAPRCRPQARAAQHGRDRGRGDTDPELEQFALDAHIAPLGFSRASRQIRVRVSAPRGTARLAAGASSTSLKQSSMPAAERLRADRKAGPALGREQRARCGEQRSVGCCVVRPPSAAPEDHQLVSQDHDLKLPLTATMGERADNPAQKPVQQPRQHQVQSEPTRPRSPGRPPRPNRISLPHAPRQAAERAVRFRMTARLRSRARRYGLYRYFLIFGLLTFARVTIAEPVP
jgi:hypothetical protein